LSCSCFNDWFFKNLFLSICLVNLITLRLGVFVDCRQPGIKGCLEVPGFKIWPLDSQLEVMTTRSRLPLVSKGQYDTEKGNFMLLNHSRLCNWLSLFLWSTPFQNKLNKSQLCPWKIGLWDMGAQSGPEFLLEYVTRPLQNLVEFDPTDLVREMINIEQLGPWRLGRKISRSFTGTDSVVGGNRQFVLMLSKNYRSWILPWVCDKAFAKFGRVWSNGSGQRNDKYRAIVSLKAGQKNFTVPYRHRFSSWGQQTICPHAVKNISK